MDYNIEQILEKIYQFEDQEKLLDYKLDDSGIPCWMYIRQSLIRKTLDSQLGIKETIYRNYYSHEHKIEEYTERNPFFTKQKDIVFAFFTNEVFSRNEEGAIGEHRMYPYMELIRESTTVLVKYLFEDKYKFQCSYPHWRSNYFFNKCIEMHKKKRNIDGKRIKEFVHYLSDNYPYPIDFMTQKKIFEKLKYIMEYQPIATSVFQRYLDVVKPKVVIINLASYLSPEGIAMTLACRKNGIVTAEIQHGTTGKWHPAYNCGNAIRKNKFCRMAYPDYFLTRGSYWGKMISIPVKTYVIGNSKLQGVKDKVKNYNILFIAETNMVLYKEILDYILPRIEKDVTIYFRLHPLRHNETIFHEFREYERHDNFVLANEKELNYYLNQCGVVVSSYSTVTYEALSVGRIVLFLKESGYEKVYQNVQNMVYEFSSGEEFMEIWGRKNEIQPRIYNSFYNNDWETKYRSFLRNIGIFV